MNLLRAPQSRACVMGGRGPSHDWAAGLHTCYTYSRCLRRREAKQHGARPHPHARATRQLPHRRRAKLPAEDLIGGGGCQVVLSTPSCSVSRRGRPCGHKAMRPVHPYTKQQINRGRVELIDLGCTYSRPFSCESAASIHACSLSPPAALAAGRHTLLGLTPPRPPCGCTWRRPWRW